MGRTISKKELAMLAGVTPGAISQQLSRKLKPALIGNRIDIDHPAVIAYFAKRAELNIAPPPPPPKKKESVTGVQSMQRRGRGRPPSKQIDDVGNVHELPSMLPHIPGLTMEEIEQLTILQVVERFGTAASVVDYLSAVKSIEDVRQKRIKNAELRGRLVARDAVKVLFGFVDEAHSRMVSDTPARAAVVIRSLLDNDPSKEDIEKIIRDQIAAGLKGVKSKVSRSLARMRKDDDDDS